MNVHNKIGTKERFLEMFQNVNKVKITESTMWGEDIKNESFDNPKEKDKEYLDKTVGDQTSQVSKYDDGTRYPVEDKLKVKDPSLEKMKGDDAPIKEAFGEENSEESELDQMDTEETGEQGGEGTEEKPAWDENFGGDEEEPEGEEPEMAIDDIPSDEEVEAPELDGEIEGDGVEIDLEASDEEVEDEHVDQIEGGLADDAQPNDFCPIQIGKGVQIEMEHTDDPHKALEIAMDHLTEIPDYYDRLEAMETEAKGESQGSQGSVEDDVEAPEDALLDPSKHWVDDYAPQNVSMGDEEELDEEEANWEKDMRYRRNQNEYPNIKGEVGRDNVASKEISNSLKNDLDKSTTKKMHNDFSDNKDVTQLNRDAYNDTDEPLSVDNIDNNDDFDDNDHNNDDFLTNRNKENY